MQFQPSKRLFADATKTGFIPRRVRSKLRSDAAMARGKLLGQPMRQNVEAMIAATGGEFWRVNQFKIGIENLLLSGTDAARMHYGDIARALPTSLSAAIVEVERDYRAAIARDRQLTVLGLSTRVHSECQTQVIRLANVRLILRLLRITGHADAYAEIRELVAEPIPLVEAFRAFHQTVRSARAGR